MVIAEGSLSPFVQTIWKAELVWLTFRLNAMKRAIMAVDPLRRAADNLNQGECSRHPANLRSGSPTSTDLTSANNARLACEPHPSTSLNVLSLFQFKIMS
jgi:hypothetical protein